MEQKVFAVTAEERVAQARHEGVRTALRTLVIGQPDRRTVASSVLFSSVLYQARLSGCGV